MKKHILTTVTFSLLVFVCMTTLSHSASKEAANSSKTYLKCEMKEKSKKIYQGSSGETRISDVVNYFVFNEDDNTFGKADDIYKTWYSPGVTETQCQIKISKTLVDVFCSGNGHDFSYRIDRTDGSAIVDTYLKDFSESYSRGNCRKLDNDPFSSIPTKF